MVDSLLELAPVAESRSEILDLLLSPRRSRLNRSGKPARQVRLLDPESSALGIKSLDKAAKALGKRVVLELVDA